MIKNAIIESTSITNSDHGCLTIWLHLNYGGSGQGFGGFNLYNQGSNDYTGMYIWKILEVVGVTDWSKLVGKTIRVDAEHNEIKAIGHILEEIWFNPKEEFNKIPLVI